MNTINMTVPFLLRHSWAKLLTFLVALPNLPLDCRTAIPFMAVGFCSTLLLHALAPNKVIVPLSMSDWGVIATNISITAGSALVFVNIIRDDVQELNSLFEIDAKQLLYVPLWILIEEIIFFYVHRYFHSPGVYSRIWPLGPGHKMHHKFKITSAWTSFYAHPVDHLFAVTWSALFPPLVQITILKHTVSIPVVTLYMFGAITTFIASHHTIIGQDDPEIAEGTPHLQHHTRFNVNFGNFGYFDKLVGSFGTASDTKASRSARIPNSQKKS